MKGKLSFAQQLSVRIRTRLIIAASCVIAVTIGITLYLQFAHSTKAIAANNGDYKNIASGNWSNAAIWQIYASGIWIDAALPPSSTNGTITIGGSTTVTVTSSVSVDQLVVDAGSTLSVSTGTLTIANGAGTDLFMNGTLDITSIMIVAGSKIDLSGVATLRSTGTLTFNAGSTFGIGAGYFKREGGTLTTSTGFFTIASGGTFEHAMNGGSLPLMTWSPGSNCLVSGITTTLPSNISQSFRNFTWNCPGQSVALDNSTNLKTIQGDFTIASTGSGSVFFDQQGNNLTMNIGGNFNVNGGTTYFCENGSDVINITGNMVVTAGLMSFCKAGATAYGNNSAVVNITGNLLVTGGTVDMSQYTANNAGKGYGIVNLEGNLNVSAPGLITETQNARGQIYFVGTAIQTYNINNQITNMIDFIVNNGAIVRCNNYVLNSDGDFTLMAGGGLMMGSPDGITKTSLTGNVQVTGSRSYSTGADYTYEGTDVQASGNGLPSQERNLTLNNVNNCTLTNSTAASGILTFTQGNWLATNDTLTLGISTAIRGTLTRTSGYVVGYFRRWIANSIAPNILFPIGTMTDYDGANFSFTTAPTAGSIVSYFSPVNPGNQGLGLTDAGVWCYNVGRGYWQFGAMNGFAGGVYTVNVYANGFPGIEDYSALHLMRRVGAGSNWTFNGTHSAGTGSNAAPVVNRTGMSLLGHYGITAGTGNALPVTLTSFNAIQQGNKIKIDWITSSEKNNDYFTLEKSADGRTFHELIRVKGAGTSNTTKNYAYVDEQPYLPISYYRLSQTDFNGDSKKFKIIAVYFKTINQLIKNGKIVPNPFNESFELLFDTEIDQNTRLEILNSTGAKVYSENLIIKAGSNFYQFKTPPNFKSGIYFLTLSGKEGLLYSSKLVCTQSL